MASRSQDVFSINDEHRLSRATLPMFRTLGRIFKTSFFVSFRKIRAFKGAYCFYEGRSRYRRISGIKFGIFSDLNIAEKSSNRKYPIILAEY